MCMSTSLASRTLSSSLPLGRGLMFRTCTTKNYCETETWDDKERRRERVHAFHGPASAYRAHGCFGHRKVGQIRHAHRRILGAQEGTGGSEESHRVPLQGGHSAGDD